MALQGKKVTLRKGLFDKSFILITDIKKIRGKKYAMQLGGFKTRKTAESWANRLKNLPGVRGQRYRKPGALVVAKEEKSDYWAVWYREV